MNELCRYCHYEILNYIAYFISKLVLADFLSCIIKKINPNNIIYITILTPLFLSRLKSFPLKFCTFDNDSFSKLCIP